jgi:adenosylcobyric acid synthase
MAKLYVVGIGPGDLRHMTQEAREAIASAAVVVGYSTYLDLITPLLEGKEVVSTGMMREVERCEDALRLAAAGKDVALVSGGDAGIYGMAGLVLELAAAPPFAKGGPGGGSPDEDEQIPLYPPLPKGDSKDVEIIVIPGVSAVQAAAAVLGAPLMHDFAVISLSDLLTPWDLIERRLTAAAVADFVVALYNPRSKGRVRHLERAREIFLAARSAETPVGIVRHACREGEERIVTTLAGMLEHHIDMFSLVIIGNSATYVDGEGRMVTPRGYGNRAAFSVQRAEKAETVDARSTQHAARALMFCGTGSDVGKSVLTAGFCRILKRRGVSVAPFKSQNMALNSAVTPEGGEIGRAQAVQAQACGIPPHTDMNPILLKPTSDTGSQVIVQGRVVGNMRVKEYHAYKPVAFERVRESFTRLRACHDVVVLEGAGSIAEINLKAHDIANLRVAAMAGAPVILVADIDRGGVFAQIVGTLELLEPEERAQIAGVIINKFRGDPSLLKPGIDFTEKRTGVPVLGVVPWFSGFRIPEEDSVALAHRAACCVLRADKLNIGVVRLPRISNYTDFDALESEPDVALSYLETPEGLAGLDVVILPGSKATIADLNFLRERGFFPAVREFAGTVIGICGGFQMLGRRIRDPEGVEGPAGLEAEGLGLLDAATVMLCHKETHQVEAELLPAGFHTAPKSSRQLAGYEIHMGETILGRGAAPFARIVRRSGREVEVQDGAVNRDGSVFGTYLHGIFDNAGFRTPLLNRLRRAKGMAERSGNETTPDPFDLLADHLEQHLDVARLLRLCGAKTRDDVSSSPPSMGGDRGEGDR